MDDRAALLRAIVEQPDDLTLRLVYADWLEENDQAEYAGFIRAQCVLDGFLINPSSSGYFVDARYVQLGQIAASLVSSLREPFHPFLNETGIGQEHLCHASTSFSVQIRRGFVETVVLHGTLLIPFIPYIPMVCDRHPIRNLSVWNWENPRENTLRASDIKSLLACEGILRLAHLDLSGLELGRHSLSCFTRLESMPWKKLLLCSTGVSPVQRKRLQKRFDQVQFIDPNDIPF